MPISSASRMVARFLFVVGAPLTTMPPTQAQAAHESDVCVRAMMDEKVRIFREALAYKALAALKKAGYTVDLNSENPNYFPIKKIDGDEFVYYPGDDKVYLVLVPPTSPNSGGIANFNWYYKESGYGLPVREEAVLPSELIPVRGAFPTDFLQNYSSLQIILKQTRNMPCTFVEQRGEGGGNSIASVETPSNNHNVEAEAAANKEVVAEVVDQTLARWNLAALFASEHIEMNGEILPEPDDDYFRKIPKYVKPKANGFARIAHNIAKPPVQPKARDNEIIKPASDKKPMASNRPRQANRSTAARSAGASRPNDVGLSFFGLE